MKSIIKKQKKQLPLSMEMIQKIYNPKTKKQGYKNYVEKSRLLKR